MTVPTEGKLVVKLKVGVDWIATLGWSGAPMDTVGVAGAVGVGVGVGVGLPPVLLVPVFGAAPPPPPPEQPAKKETSRHEAANARGDFLYDMEAPQPLL
jgi:hypothetical protein